MRCVGAAGIGIAVGVVCAQLGFPWPTGILVTLGVLLVWLATVDLLLRRAP